MNWLRLCSTVGSINNYRQEKTSWWTVQHFVLTCLKYSRGVIWKGPRLNQIKGRVQMHSATLKIDGAWNEVPKGREGTGELFGRWETLPREGFLPFIVSLKCSLAGYNSLVNVLPARHTFHLSLTDKNRSICDFKSAEFELGSGRDKENIGFIKTNQAEQAKLQLNTSKWQGVPQLD